MNLEQLRQHLKALLADLATLKTKAEAADATEADVTSLTTKLDEIEAVKAKIKTFERVEAAQAAAAAPAGIGHNSGSVPATPKDTSKLSTVEKVGVALQGLILAKHNGYAPNASGTLKGIEDLGYAGLAAEFGMKQKVAANGSAAGGFLIPQDMSNDIIEFLAPETAFLQGNPVQIPMPTGSYVEAGVASRPTASYRGEGKAIASSDLTFRQINMKAKLLSSIVPVTNQIIAYSPQQVVSMVMREMRTVMSETMDRVAFLGLNVASEPGGILRMPNHFSTAATNSTAPSQVQVDSDARKLLNRFEWSPILMRGLAWVMSRRSLGYLQDLRTPGGENYAYPSLQGARPTWKGYPVLITGAILNNGGAGTDETEIALVSFGNVLLGNTKAMELATSTEAVVNGVSMFETDQTAVRSTAEHDFEARYVEAVGRLTGVRWGAGS